MAGTLLFWQLFRNELHGLPTVEADGHWYVIAPDGERVPIPGARFMKVREMVGERIRTTQRYGRWVEIDRETAHSDSDLLHWCRRHCNSELPSGTFRFSPNDWNEQCGTSLSTPFFPELDHPSPTIRELAEAELLRRIAEHEARINRDQRDELVRAASDEGHSRRELADLLGISFGRVQQLVHQDTR